MSAAPLFRLTVGGDIVASNILRDTVVRNDIDVVSFTRNYDGPAELAFAIRHGWKPNEFAAGLAVRLLLAGDIVFVGRTSLLREGANALGSTTDYLCRDGSSIYRLATLDSPLLQDPAAFNFPTATLGAILSVFMPAVASKFAAMGISSTPIFSPAGAANIPCLPVGFYWVSIDEAVRAIAAAAPGVRVFVDPNGGTPAYHFVQLFASGITTLTLEDEVVGDLRIEQSLDGCAGAVRCNNIDVSLGGTGYTGFIAGLRYPTSGFSGRAYSLDPVATGFERQVTVPIEVSQSAYAQAALAVLSEPVIRGSVSLENVPPGGLYRLALRVSFDSAVINPTGYETLAAPLMGINYQLRDGPTLTLDFSTQRTLPGEGGP